MKILVIGLDCAAPELLLGDERLVNIRRLMAAGCFGRLTSVVPPITVPAWMCLATSQDPGSLGVYGFRNRADRSYDALQTVDSKAIRQWTIWDQIAREGRRVNIVGVPPNYPPRRVHGISIGCFLTPDNPTAGWIEPAAAGDDLVARFGPYQVDVRGYRTPDKRWLLEQIRTMTRQHFAVVRHLLTTTEWDYFQFVEIGLDRLHHGFWQYHDPQHVLYEPNSPFADAITDYYLELDDEIGRVLECLTEETAILIVSDHGAQRLDGGFCINQWLVDQGLLVLDETPREPTPFSKLRVNWSRTKVWSEGGYYARVFLNVRGREPQGTIEPADYETFREEMRQRLLGTLDPDGRPLGTLVFKPEEIYRSVRGIAPDLIAHFGGLYWRSVGGVGYAGHHVRENDTGPDGCNHAQHGAFVLAAATSTLRGEIVDAHLLDMSPTLLTLAGYDIPETMQGRALTAGAETTGTQGDNLDDSVRDRLQGLGYLG